MRYRGALLLLMAALAGCSVVHRDAGSGRFLDQETGDSTLVVTTPLLFARERTDVAAHARDYATLVAVETSNGGKYAQFLLLYRWSTVDKRMSAPPASDAGHLRLLADARQLDFTPLDPMPFTLSRRKAMRIPPKADVVAWAYPVDVATLRFIAQSKQLRLRMAQDAFDAPFSLWKADGRAGLQQFLQRLGSP